MTREIEWRYRGQSVRLGMDEVGDGPVVLLLPALSSISTRGEMRPLIERLPPRWRSVSVDWPGFGDKRRPRLDWSAAVLSDFLDWLLSEVAPNPFAIVAAGHASTYVLAHLNRRPGSTSRLVLCAPTWRGPLPSMMGGARPWFAHIRAAIDAPILGPALYALNVSPPVVRKMAAEHVYSDPASYAVRADEKRAVTRAAGARHASVRFVTGALDRVAERSAFLRLAEQAGVPILLLYGEETPPKSRAEMEALSAIAGIETVRLQRGKLALHEEFAEEIAGPVMRFLERTPR